MRSGNPSLNDKTFKGLGVSDEPMTLAGTVNKTAILLALVLITAGYTWGRFFESGGDPSSIMTLMWVGIIGGLVMALVTVFKKQYVAYTAPAYALLEGLAVGGISAFYEVRFEGVVIQAVGLTFGTLFCLLFAYKTGLIKATENFKLGITAATGAIFLLYIVNMVLSLFDMPIGFIHEGGTFGIIFSLVVVTVAALNLVLDFDFIEAGVEQGAPKFMEWYGAFGLVVTLVWLYLEMLRLLSKLRGD
ncbi:Bax inhibitor-1/YccA family protein [Ketobacter sp. MCCC 1A13808]|uniref:Bax inhibitor-1/YccA family protein n=1 Tax=Ketobacter sp. MCCC 1A13808 TaxID=2602738 RepID=UPI0012EBF7CB|nr:Bax inhibitor-1/YccA family protein [Ketobacter sp. MCCC 1A13808]MVF13786.1 Bax inhibitor-1/YccA family protein [Ketobacter sp. MCCC 1A13808]